MDPRDTRSALAKARFLGAAKEGVEHWWALRVSSVALVPLTLWFAAELIARTGGDHAAVVEWLGRPHVTVLMILLLIATFHHASLGLRVIIEDYRHGPSKFVLLILTRFACYAFGLAGILATLRIAFSG